MEKEKENENENKLNLLPKNKPPIKLCLNSENWIKDKDVQSCFNCDKKFIFLVRRKHHCRMCGRIFCSNCSRHKVDAIKFGIEYHKRKMRVCDYCFKYCETYLQARMKHTTDDLEKIEPRKDSRNSLSTFSSEEDVAEINENYLFNLEPAIFESSSSMEKEHSKIIFGKIENIVKYYLKDRPKWYDLLQNNLKIAIQEVKPDTISRTDSMDINHYIKIKKILFKDHTLTEYYRGIICRKNVSSKKMNTNFMNAKILLISQSIDITNDNLVSFDYIIQNEKKNINKLVEKIIKINPDIILVEKHVNRFAQELFLQKNITLIQKVKPSLLKKIARLTKGKIIKDLTKISKFTPDKILGKCTRFFLRKMDFSIKNQDPTLLYIIVSSSNYGGTLTVSGPDINELIDVKAILKKILKIAHHLFLEKDLVINEIKYIKLLDSSNFTYGNFSSYSDEKLNFEDMLNQNEIAYTKINYVKANNEDFPDICGNALAVQNIHQIISDFSKSKVINKFIN